MTRALILVAAVSLAAAALSADVTGTHAYVTIAPVHPRVEEPCRVSASLRTRNGYPLFPQHVTIVGEMTGHPMRPVEAELQRAPGAGEFTGTLAFTMRGPWRLTLRVEEGSSALVGVAGIEVVGADADTGGSEIRYMVDLAQPPRANLLPPAWVLAGAIALTVAMQRTAAFAARRKARASGTPAGA
jgi:hypothetical protein